MADEKFDQSNAVMQITLPSPVKSGEVGIEQLSGTEGLSVPFRFKLKLLSENKAIDMKTMLRKSATINLLLANNKTRYINGVLISMKQGPAAEAKEASSGQAGVSAARKIIDYEAILVPKLWLLSLKNDCRIFQQMSTTDIAEKILKEASVDYTLSTTKTYQPRDYCVQYRESSLNFISRLMEEDGIFYYFVHEDGKHTMVLHDNSSQLSQLPNQTDPVDYENVEEKQDALDTLHRVEQAHTGQVTLNDYNFETPKNSLVATAPGQDEEVYDYHGRYAVKGDGDTLARTRIEELEHEQFVISGDSHLRTFQPGYYFTLQNHYRDDTNQDYVLNMVTHNITDASFRWQHGGEHGGFEYHNVYRALPKSVPFRPSRRAKKTFVQGTQTALVVGPSGEEIWCDKYGRVKVQFYWDRVGTKDEKSSCWIRVSQPWAGKGWGGMAIPRIGQEVVVDYIEGDPDYPIITGKVYNADQMPPYTLPDNSTQTGIQSRSSKGGGTSNFNQIQLEDKKGAEQFNIQAEYDMTTLVKHDRTETIKGKHTETITGDTTIEITQGNLSKTIDQGNETRKVSMGNQSLTISMGNQTNSISMGKIDTDAMQSITLTVGGSSIKIDQMGVTIKGMMIEVDGDIMTTVKGDAMLTLKGGITMIN